MKYRVFIKYCVFPKNVVIFLNSASSAAALVLDLPSVHTLTPRGNRERPESEIYLKIFEITQYLMNALYHVLIDDIAMLCRGRCNTAGVHARRRIIRSRQEYRLN